MNIITAIKEWVRRMITRSDIKSTYGSDTAITDSFAAAINEWARMYAGKAEWVDNDSVHSLRLEQSITREFANTVLNEMTATVFANDKLNEIYKSAVEDINKHFQRGLATGAMVIKPLGADKVQFVSQDAFVPIEYDVNGRLIKVIFPEIKQISESTYVTRLEYHSLDYENGLTITNRAFLSHTKDTLGREIPLASVDEWANLVPEITYPAMLRPAFGYYVNPIDNTVDNSHGGVSIFEPARHLIRLADIQFGRLDWEFESGERAIYADELALKTTDGKKRDVPRLKQRLFKTIGANDDFFKEFSPQLRQADFITGLDTYKREIEFAVGLSYGDISSPQSVDKTATEVKASKQRKYDTVTAIQSNLKNCLDDLVYALAFYNSMTQSGYEFNVNFEDSVLTDDDTKRTQDRQDVSMGALQLWEYRMRWYGEDEKTARAMVAGANADVVE
ncbi:MAG: phage capsid protein [Ruminococcus sp.]|nr:phage capsid protein [Ruminococcus sp.]